MATLALPAVPIACPLARSFVRWMLTWWRLDHALDIAELLTAELVGNALTSSQLPAGTAGHLVDVQLRLTAGDDRLRIEVHDLDLRPPVPRVPDADDEGGRGLLLVEALAERWGHDLVVEGPGPAGKVVWAEIATPAPTTARGLPIRPRPACSHPHPADPALLRRVSDCLHHL
ncbi:ATP-binding protein [Frankia sp. CNm7]|uniref:ATP-binding protein n=1 Tax=Frankia nepalensis TaxID=1836974 RepID=A0A937RPB6_9ACTN|nr:ATP-binding protein [Frankia nepalensis]MBL7498295.1 ATP-binding protein [Frankia nepalensis]MBL7509113.1 ATP-binding protein [Frankia nepalensis]MBL7520800.1 ATP-binding protein [Frankia nepalensis]MBL7630158.1 ATP-binding protein [Frankia nepalensis]